MSDPALPVAIVGGGIGGLATAVALTQAGVSVNLYEQSPRLGEVGAGVMMMPNGIRVLHQLGFEKAVDRLGAPIGEGSMYYRMDGTPVTEILTTDSSGWPGMYGMHRADLLSMLADALPAGIVHTGHRCVSVEQDPNGVRINFDNGASAEASIAIGADGIQSALRSTVTTPAPPVHSGWLGYRGLLPTDRLPHWRTDISQMWMGEDKHFLVFPVRRGTMINYVGFVPADSHTAESWSAQGDPQALAAEFVGWDPQVESLLAQVTQTFWWGLYDREPLTQWTHGRVTLVGDAAHPMLPHAGQGANQALEDAMTLSVLLAEVADPSSVIDALKLYESLRIDRTRRVQAESRALGRRYDSADEDLDRRDQELEEYANFKLWLADHDARATANNALC